MKALGEQQLTVDGTAKALPSIPATATNAVLVLERSASGTAQVNARFSLTDTPTTSVGMPLGQLGRFDVSGKQNLANFRIISADGLSHTLSIIYS